MTDKIYTSTIDDLLQIFDQNAQITEDTGGARILYTIPDNGEPVRERVGSTFILSVGFPECSFFVSLPVDSLVSEGSIVPAELKEELRDRYPLSTQGIQDLIFDIKVAYDVESDETVSELINK